MVKKKESNGSTRNCLHQLLFGAFRADDFILVSDETFAHETRAAICAEEAVVVPVPVLKRNEFGAADTCNGSAASEASLREELAEALGAVWFVVTTSEAGSRQTGLAVRAGETFPMPRFVLVCYAATCNHLQSYVI